MTDRAKKFATTLWALENPSKDSIDHYIKVGSQDTISIFFRHIFDDEWGGSRFLEMKLSRRKARLLAKRLNQMLDETK